jgi:hypothetical protein
VQDFSQKVSQNSSQVQSTPKVQESKPRQQAQETGTRPKITFESNPQKKVLQKEDHGQINEIDKGIEPGLVDGNCWRKLQSRIPPKNKAVKKPFEEAIGAGGEDGNIDEVIIMKIKFEREKVSIYNHSKQRDQ